MTILLLRQTTDVDVAAQVERHHGQPGGVPDDVDYMGQYETDVANVIAALRHDQPNGRFILAG